MLASLNYVLSGMLSSSGGKLTYGALSYSKEFSDTCEVFHHCGTNHKVVLFDAIRTLLYFLSLFLYFFQEITELLIKQKPYLELISPS